MITSTAQITNNAGAASHFANHEPLIGVFMILSVLAAVGLIRWSIYSSYAFTVGAAAALAYRTDSWPYYFAFMLGMLTALAEVISKFRDEPLKSLRTPQAVLYHVFNGSIAAFGLHIYKLSSAPLDTELEQLKAIVGAGLGSMLLMRSKLFNIKVDGEDVSFGPEQIVRVFLSFMEGAIDRVRAQSRIDLVTARLINVDFDRALPYCQTMLQASQTLGEREQRAFETEVDKLKRATNDKQLRSYRLGFLLLNVGGEAYLDKLFREIPIEWRVKAPEPPQPARLDGIRHLLPFAPRSEQMIPYFAYGANMSSHRIRARLNWLDRDSIQWLQRTNARPARVSGYRIEFDRPDPNNPKNGLANIVPDSAGSLEGVVYQLTPQAFDFLDKAEEGYHRAPIRVEVDGRPLEAQCMMAHIVREGLQPSPEYMQLLVTGAREHRLSPEYIAQLEGQRAKLPAQPAAREATTGEGPSAEAAQ